MSALTLMHHPPNLCLGQLYVFPRNSFSLTIIHPTLIIFSKSSANICARSGRFLSHKHKKRAFYFKDLYNCTHVFLRNVAKRALERPYTDTHKAIQRISERVFNVDINGTPKSVSVDLLKPAYFVPDDPADLPTTSGNILNWNVNPTPALKTYSRKTVTFAPSTKPK